MTDASISALLRRQLKDLTTLYDKAVEDHEPVVMEKLAKTCAGLAQQIQRQELHERDTLNREQVVRLAVECGSAIGRVIKSQVNEEKPTPLTLNTAYLIIELANAEVLKLVQEYE